VLDEIQVVIGCIDAEIYGPFESTARERLCRRDEEDWPVLATALALECPIWTEDADFFGAGVATWTTDRVELLLREFESEPGEPAQ
jgi:predicted nucleic acid-binding protein